MVDNNSTQSMVKRVSVVYLVEKSPSEVMVTLVFSRETMTDSPKATGLASGNLAALLPELLEEGDLHDLVLLGLGAGVVDGEGVCFF